MIQTNLLTATAKINKSKNNNYLWRLWSTVDFYNVLPEANVKVRIEALDTIMLIAAEFLTSRRPTLKVKNSARWSALADLADQCAREAQALGAKQLTSPSDFRQIKGDPNLASQSYWLERLDPLRRPGFQLSGLYEQWLASNVNDDFWTFSGFFGGLKWTPANKPMQVKLLDESLRAKRLKYLATITNAGTLEDFHGQPFTTLGTMQTEASGENWGIFVLSPEKQLYLHSHKLGRFHHSTFLGGAAVAAAGEMVVDESGAIRLITAKTGHYRSGVEEMRRLVTLLPINPDAIILPDLLMLSPPPKGQNKALFYRVGDFRAYGTNAIPLNKFTVNLRTPFWAKNTKSNKMFAKVPVTTYKIEGGKITKSV